MTNFGKHHAIGVAAVCLLAMAVSATVIRNAMAEDAAAPANGPDHAAAPSAGSSPVPPPAERGFFNEFGHWWHQSFGDFGGKMDAARQQLGGFGSKQHDNASNAVNATADVMKNAAGAAKDAATAVVRLPGTRVLDLHERCQTAPNGAPDCRAAAVNACQKNGFNSGQPIDIVTSQQCPAAVLLSGRKPAEGECPDETSVLRAVCQ